MDAVEQARRWVNAKEKALNFLQFVETYCMSRRHVFGGKQLGV
jgi:hypothetical protein